MNVIKTKASFIHQIHLRFDVRKATLLLTEARQVMFAAKDLSAHLPRPNEVKKLRSSMIERDDQ
jgi:hypothetical protein